MALRFPQEFFVLVIALASIASASTEDFYGKPCTNDSSSDEPHLVHCNLDRNMYCSEKGICECIVGERGRQFSHVHHDRSCIEISTSENKFACTDDVQCKMSTYGRYSRCNRDYDRCECHDSNEKTVLLNSVCFIQNPPRAQRSARGFHGCSEDSECQASPLGQLSRCNEADSSCECYDTRSSGKQDTDEYNGRCVYKKKLMEFCKEDDECRVGYHKHAICAPHPTYLPNEKVCQCPEGRKCDDDGSGAFRPRKAESQSLIMIALTTVMMGVVATKVLG